MSQPLLAKDPLLASILTTVSPSVSEPDARSLALEHYGLHATVRKLSSERDQMFRLAAESGSQYLLKISNPAEPPEITDFQTAAIEFIETQDPSLPVQRLIPDLGGKTALRLSISGTAPRTVRLLSFLQGKPVASVNITQRLRSNLGVMLARLALALDGFDHPQADYELAWDIAHLLRLEPLLSSVADRPRRELVEMFIDQFREFALPRLGSVRRQVVHNDLNTHNVLVDPHDMETVSGVFDFGDVVRTQRINDVAIGASYHVGHEDPDLAHVLAFLSGYNHVSALTEAEIDLLPELIAARHVATVLITGWRAQLYPENSAYILKNNGVAWTGLEALSRISLNKAREIFHRALRKR